MLHYVDEHRREGSLDTESCRVICSLRQHRVSCIAVFRTVAGVQKSSYLVYGAASLGSFKLTLFLARTVDAQMGLYRSNDGRAWVRINADVQQYLGIGRWNDTCEPSERLLYPKRRRFFEKSARTTFGSASMLNFGTSARLVLSRFGLGAVV